MEKKETKVTRITYSVDCPECKKMIKGNSPRTVEWNLDLHIKQKHNQDLNKKEDDKNENN